jgi:DNA-binding NarL/FixJ family response regulator
VLIDNTLPDGDGISAARAIKTVLPDTSIILVNDSYDADVVAEAIAAGCSGVLDKTRAWVELVGAVRAAYFGQTTLSEDDLRRVLPRLSEARPSGRTSFLTRREREVLACIADGQSNRAVADRLGITANTVRNHVQRILYKLGVHSKLEAVVIVNQEATNPI